ncbi:WG repeat-containing protein [Paenibacillus sp. MMS18-CY102]|uniref:WG repeat-containing protein n=1 Tax=Paenibacillus sp. MMS18-CY102 TaxID=2682849 RepID=UPI0013663459|nr:WG repeat-containing protein [Paenibacillus sp. MMS18-CY102]MWC27121.1 hypothetical protein [Paenibacillus sp. MMS18-CY102]
MVFGLAGMGDSQQRANAATAATVTATAIAETSSGNQLYYIEENGKYGFINGKGEVVIEPIYDSLGNSAQPGGAVYAEDRAAKKQIYFSPKGEKLFECESGKCGIMSNGLAMYIAAVKASDGTAVTRYGYIDSRGKIVIQPIYHRAFHFSEGFARVNLGKASGFINTKGELITPYRYSQTADFADGMAAVSLTVGGKYGFIDTSGKLAISPRFDYVSGFSDGVAAVSVNGKYGYIDKKGRYILPPQFTMAQPFSEGLAFVERNGVTFYINKAGKKVIQTIKAGGTFSGGLAPASRGQTYGYINKSGAFVIKSQFEWADSFSGDLAVVYVRIPQSSNYVTGYIDRSGAIVWKEGNTHAHGSNEGKHG